MKKKIAFTGLVGFTALLLASCGGTEAPTTTTTTTTEAAAPSAGGTDNTPTNNNNNTGGNGNSGTTDTKKYIPEVRITHGADTVNPTESSTYWLTAPVSNVVKTEKASWGVIDTSPDPYYQTCSITVKDETKTETITDAEAQVKVRGNWTTNYDKKSMRIKYTTKQSMLGLNDNNKFKNWVLLAGYKDWSLLRDSAGFYMTSLISDNYASDAKPVAVYVNDEFWGIYTLAEQQEAKKNRININVPEENYTGTDIGYLLEYDGYARYEDANNKFTVVTDPFDSGFKDYYGVGPYYFNEVKSNSKGNSSPGAHSYAIKSDIYSKDQTDFIQARMENITKICLEANKGNFYEFKSDYSGIQASSVISAQECVSKVIDLDSLVETYLLQEIIVDPDLYYSSFYMDIDFSETGSKKLTFEAPWDFDSTMGNKYDTTTQHYYYSAGAKVPGINFVNGEYDYNPSLTTVGIYAGMVGDDVDGNYCCSNPWMIMFAGETWFQDLCKAKWAEIKADKVLEKTQAYITDMTTTYGEDFEKNFTKWTNTRANSGVLNELNPRAIACTTQAQSAAYVSTWLGERFAILDGIFGA